MGPIGSIRIGPMQRFPLSGGDHGLGDAHRAFVAAVKLPRTVPSAGRPCRRHWPATENRTSSTPTSLSARLSGWTAGASDDCGLASLLQRRAASLQPGRGEDADGRIRPAQGGMNATGNGRVDNLPRAGGLSCAQRKRISRRVGKEILRETRNKKDRAAN